MTQGLIGGEHHCQPLGSKTAVNASDHLAQDIAWLNDEHRGHRRQVRSADRRH